MGLGSCVKQIGRGRRHINLRSGEYPLNRQYKLLRILGSSQFSMYRRNVPLPCTADSGNVQPVLWYQLSFLNTQRTHFNRYNFVLSIIARTDGPVVCYQADAVADEGAEDLPGGKWGRSGFDQAPIPVRSDNDMSLMVGTIFVLHTLLFIRNP
jgi:hypothetical protein